LNKNKDTDSDYIIIQEQIQSRHVNASQYDVFIKYKPNINDIRSNEGWIRTCKNGKRTVGCCSHVASILFYLRYQ